MNLPRTRWLLPIASTFALIGCALQPAHSPAALNAPSSWSIGAAEESDNAPDEHWWRAMQDPAVDALVDATLAGSPTLAQALARGADARGARLVVAAQVTNAVLARRACMFSLETLDEDIASRARTLALTQWRVAAGSVPSMDSVLARTGWASARTARALRQQECAHQLDMLVALTGKSAAAVPDSFAQLPQSRVMPCAPAMRLAPPAHALQPHPTVMAARHDLAALWDKIGVARAERLPRLDLAALLGTQWLRPGGGATSVLSTWSVAPSLAATVFDGRRGPAGVAAALARYRHAVAVLQSSVRTAAINLFELEDARRQFAAAQDSASAAERDEAQAWVALVRASGNAIHISRNTRQRSLLVVPAVFMQIDGPGHWARRRVVGSAPAQTAPRAPGMPL